MHGPKSDRCGTSAPRSPSGIEQRAAGHIQQECQGKEATDAQAVGHMAYLFDVFESLPRAHSSICKRPEEEVSVTHTAMFGRDRDSESFGATMLSLCSPGAHTCSIWEFPKIRSLNVNPYESK